MGIVEKGASLESKYAHFQCVCVCACTCMHVLPLEVDHSTGLRVGGWSEIPSCLLMVLHLRPLQTHMVAAPFASKQVLSTYCMLDRILGNPTPVERCVGQRGNRALPASTK